MRVSELVDIRMNKSKSAASGVRRFKSSLSWRRRPCGRVERRARIQKLELDAKRTPPRGDDNVVFIRDRDAVFQRIGGELGNAQPGAKHRALIDAPARTNLLQPVIDGSNVVAAHAKHP